MKIVIAEDRGSLGQFVAEQAAETLRQALSDNSSCNLVVATGSSQFEVLECLISQPGIDWSRIDGFHLDEYLGISREHSASFCGYLHSRFVSKVPLRSFFFMDGMLPAEQLKRSASEAIGGRTIHLLLCGIGENAHLAFNDPPANFDARDPYLIVNLDEACRQQQVGEGWFDSLAQVPTQAISMSVHQILRAEAILCAVPDRRKAQAVKASLEGEVSPEVPASALQNHPATTLVIDASSASLLSQEKLAECVHLESTGNLETASESPDQPGPTSDS